MLCKNCFNSFSGVGSRVLSMNHKKNIKKSQSQHKIKYVAGVFFMNHKKNFKKSQHKLIKKKHYKAQMKEKYKTQNRLNIKIIIINHKIT